jgi:hypothetical protein
MESHSQEFGLTCTGMESNVIQHVRFVILFVVLASASIAVKAQTKDEVLEGMIEAENAGYDVVEDYILKTNTLGMTTFEYYERTVEIETAGGQKVYVMSQVPPNEIQERHAGGNALSNASSAELRNAAGMMDQAGRDLEQGMMSEMQDSGLPGGIGTMLMNPPPDQPWLSPNPRDMTSMYATMLNASADGKDARDAEDPVGDAERRAQGMAAVQAQTRITGRREFNGTDAIELAADNLNYSQVEDGQQVTWDAVTMLVDANKYVPLLFTMEGVVTDGSESRRITVEREDLDYRNVPGCGDMYRPFKSIMRLGGMMTSEQQAELAEASVQLEQLEAQMASMPASQRQMMESMLGPQLEMIKNMASGGGIEVVSTIAELRCNTGLPDPIEIANTMFGGAFMGGNVGAVETTTGGGAINTEEDLLKMIQIDLERLGYGPGNTDGVLDKATVVAITKFQASKGMEVTGQPSSQLAGILQAIVAN